MTRHFVEIEESVEAFTFSKVDWTSKTSTRQEELLSNVSVQVGLWFTGYHDEKRERRRISLN